MLLILIVMVLLVLFWPEILFSLYFVGVVAFIGIFLMCVGGCTELRPVSVPIEVTHVSHLTQHFESGKQDYGYNAASIGLKWKLDPHLELVLSEGVVLDKEHYYGDNTKACGSLGGPREVFTGRVTYEIPLK
jgi:hypothetical protein